MSNYIKKINSWVDKESKKQTKVEKTRGVILLIVIIIFVSKLFSGSNDENIVEAPKANEPETEIIAEPSEVPQKELSLSERLVILAKDKIDPDVTLDFNEQEGFISAKIADKDYTFLNETDMANSIWDFFIPFAQEAFSNDEINRIKIAITSEFVDSYGESSIHDSVFIDMDKSDFNKFNWDNLKFTNPKNNQELVDKTNYFIHGLIYKKVKEDKLKIIF